MSSPLGTQPCPLASAARRFSCRALPQLMTNKSPFFFAALFLFGGLARLPAQSATGPASGVLEVIARNGADKEKHLFSSNGVVPMLMVRPNQVVPVTLQFPTVQAGTPVVALPLDGGKIGGGQLGVLPTGKTVFTFSPGPAFGRYRVEVRTPFEQHLLEFYVVDPNNPPWRKRPGAGN